MLDPKLLSLYRCHKLVLAGKIRCIGIDGVGDDWITLEGLARFRAPDGWMSRYKPDDLTDPGYFIVYEDGYTSWSPTKAFEEGYALDRR